MTDRTEPTYALAQALGHAWPPPAAVGTPHATLPPTGSGSAPVTPQSEDRARFSRGWSEFVITATTGCSVVVTVQAPPDGEQFQLRAAGHQALASVQDLADVRRGGG